MLAGEKRLINSIQSNQNISSNINFKARCVKSDDISWNKIPRKVEEIIAQTDIFVKNHPTYKDLPFRIQLVDILAKSEEGKMYSSLEHTPAPRKSGAHNKNSNHKLTKKGYQKANKPGYQADTDETRKKKQRYHKAHNGNPEKSPKNNTKIVLEREYYKDTDGTETFADIPKRVEKQRRQYNHKTRSKGENVDSVKVVITPLTEKNEKNTAKNLLATKREYKKFIKFVQNNYNEKLLQNKLNKIEKDFDPMDRATAKERRELKEKLAFLSTPEGKKAQQKMQERAKHIIQEYKELKGVREIELPLKQFNMKEGISKLVKTLDVFLPEEKKLSKNQINSFRDRKKNKRA